MARKRKSEAEIELEQLIKLEGLLDAEVYDKKYKELTQKVALSKRGRSSKAKGANYERTIKKILKDKLGIDLERTPQSGGFAKSKNLKSVKGDLNSLDDTIDFRLHIECKNHKSWSIKEWWKQATEDCPNGKLPILIMHRGQENKDGKRVQEAEDFVFLRLVDFLDLVDKTKIIGEDRK